MVKLVAIYLAYTTKLLTSRFLTVSPRASIVFRPHLSNTKLRIRMLNRHVSNGFTIRRTNFGNNIRFNLFILNRLTFVTPTLNNATTTRHFRVTIQLRILRRTNIRLIRKMIRPRIRQIRTNRLTRNTFSTPYNRTIYLFLNDHSLDVSNPRVYGTRFFLYSNQRPITTRNVVRTMNVHVATFIRRNLSRTTNNFIVRLFPSNVNKRRLNRIRRNVQITNRRTKTKYTIRTTLTTLNAFTIIVTMSRDTIRHTTRGIRLITRLYRLINEILVTNSSLVGKIRSRNNMTFFLNPTSRL